MTWTAELLSTEKQPTQPINLLAHCRLFNTDTQESILFDVNASDLSIETISKIAAQRIATLEVRDAAKSTLDAQTKGVPLNLPDLVPTKEQMDRINFDKLSRAAQFLRATFGAEDPRTIDIATQASILYKAEYLGL